MNVCLIIPPSPFLLSDKAIPWLGPLWVAAWLRNSGHTVSIMDLTGSADLIEDVTRGIQRTRAACYGLTGTSQDYATVRLIGEYIRRIAPKCRIILGGAHATINAAACLHDGWDAVVAGDGFAAAEKALRVNGLHRADTAETLLYDVDSLPLPARDLINLNAYNFQVCGERATAVMTAFGCPRGCTFCCGRNSQFYRRLRAFSPRRVLYEWDDIRANYPQFTALMDYADEWNIPTARAIALADAIAAHPNKWHIRCCVKAEYFTPEVAAAMARAGVVEVLCGVESGSDRILQVIKKGTTSDVNGQARNLAKQYGIRFKALTMIGLPTETGADVDQTKQWLLTYKPDDFDITVYQPLYGSPIADDPAGAGRGLYFTPTMLPYKTGPGEYRSTTRTDALTAEEIVALRDSIDCRVRTELGLPLLSRPLESSMGQTHYARATG